MSTIKEFGERMKGFTEALDKFVENNLMDKEQRDEKLKNMTKAVDSFIDNFSIVAELPQRKTLQVKKLEHFKGELPAYESVWASGMDVRAQIEETLELKPMERTLVPTGLSMAIPQGYEIQVRPRSGLAIREGLSLVNTPGTIDADYRGELKVIVINLGQEVIRIKDQDRIAQLVLCPIVQADWKLVDELASTQRGEGGFGSTGKM